MQSYIFDGSYLGFLTAIFECFERREWLAIPLSRSNYHPSFFDKDRSITTDPQKAIRVITGLRMRCSKQEVSGFYRTFLSEEPKAWHAIFAVIILIFRQDRSILDNYGDPQVLHYAQTLKRVNRERHRMKAFVRFEKSSDGLFYALIDPDFNVLPLIVDFFKKRYADQHWLIYDVKRNYGIHYDQTNIQEVQLSKIEQNDLITVGSHVTLDDTENKYQRLWTQYFKSTNIVARRNMKLHLQHVPKRYWKYLTEKKASELL